MGRRSNRGLLAVAIGIAVALWAAAVAGEGAKLPIGSLRDGVVAALFAPSAMPPGSNDWSCRPSRAHPYPVVLVHGTFANAAFTWQALSPMLANGGYCVFALNYGGNSWSAGRFFAVSDIAASAGELAAFVERVLAATGAPKVDLVGHSQGGMMPRYYLKHHGGGAKTHLLVGLAPSNHGTSVLGLNALLRTLSLAGVPGASLNGCAACKQQVVPSQFIDELNAGGETVPGPRYLVIATAYDEVVTPYQSAFLSAPEVRNIRLQDQCAGDFTDHIGIVYDSVALQETMNALGANDPNFRPQCNLIMPVIGG